MFSTQDSPVVVLDMKHHTFTSLDFTKIKDKPHQTVKIPRWKYSVPVYLPGPASQQDEYVATVNFRHLGFGYNVQRALGANQQLYVLTA
ncbi:hypothetical protein EDB80DRAFT_729843 [Ilyonectria destructans]|nr:hypothetical protein EDB80DRAFT_729843 [Ilyonectria destructans]